MEKVLILVVLVVISTLYVLWQTTQKHVDYEEDYAITKVPEIEITQYRGVWMPFLREVKISLEDIDNLRLDGINTVAIGVKVCKRGERDSFYVCEDEEEIKEAIDDFHRNGLGTFLVLNPANPDSGMDPESPEGKGKDLLDKLTPLVLKWAVISEKHGVEMFCPVNEPQMLGYKNDSAVSEWAQEILPRIRGIYKGKIAFEVQGAKEHRYNLTGYDYVADGGLTCTRDIADHPGWVEEMVDEEFLALKSNYPGLGHLLFNAGAFTGPDYYPWEPIASENMKNNSRGWPADFFTVSFKAQAEFYDMVFRRTWNETDGYFLPVYRGWEYRNKPAEAVIREWFNRENADL